MKLSPIIAQLRSYCPLFERRVFGGVDWDLLEEAGKLPVPAAYVVVGDDDADPSETTNVVNQNVTDTFHVFVVLPAPDDRTATAIDAVDAARRQLLLSLVGWRPESFYDMAQYVGGELLFANRARMVYRYTFFAEWCLGRALPTDPPETWQEQVLDGLPILEGITVNVDVIDPAADRNLKYPGPDGRIEAILKEEFKP
ncbi:hypothetical protein PEP31012_00862 [Pandoraea eparura]|uniref:Uncharacterized protein n=1 Tax=Pandoraea eparura TaxID=2508291 RepID=A0A5E4SN20_9BURK|nr:hypothetical protein [Pandoraea eparura]VVD76353.1 hypothetical protein PEP31012_00862 [Pandoraea eparura]